jgi:hypothetical protein
MGGSSSSMNSIDNTMKSAITTAMNSKISATMNLSCQNIQEVENVQNCSITFAPQFCEISGIANVSSNSELVAESTNEVYSAVKQMSEASVSGFVPGIQISNSSNFAKTLMDVATTTTQAFATDCSKNASAVNTQSIKDASCDEKTQINFAAQNASASIIGDCAVGVTGRSKAYNKVTSVMDQTSTATVKGVDPFAFLLMLLLPFLMILLLPLGMGALKSALGVAMKNPTPEQQQRAKLVDVINALLKAALVYGFVVWPGIVAYSLSTSPYLPPMPGNDSICLKGTYIAEETFINKFMFVDPTCATAPQGKTCDKTRHYTNCGVFSGLCPAAAADINRFTLAATACARVNGIIASDENAKVGLQYCRSQDVAGMVFAQDVKYKGCSLCADSDSPLWHTWVKEGATCEKSPDVIKMLKYKRTASTPCEAGDELGYCVETDSDLTKIYPNDCLDDAYQARKKVFSKLLRACNQVESTTVIPKPADGEPPRLLRAMCEPKVFDYMKCDAVTKKCSYSAPAGASQQTVAACANSFDGCEDEEYLADRKVWEAYNANCEARWQATQNRDFWIMAISAVVYGLILLGIVGTAFQITRQPAEAAGVAMPSMDTSAVEVASSPVRYNFVVPTLLVLVIVAGGLLIALSTGSFPFSAETIRKWDSLDKSQASTWGYIILSVGVVAFVIYLAWLMNARSRAKSIVATQPNTNAASNPAASNPAASSP